MEQAESRPRGERRRARLAAFERALEALCAELRAGAAPPDALPALRAAVAGLPAIGSTALSDKQRAVLTGFYLDAPDAAAPAGCRAAAQAVRLKTLALVTSRSFGAHDCYLQVLRHHSSFSPLLPAAHPHRSGGGYFAALRGYGLVIDPGHHFLDNFYAAGRTIADIDGIVVSHFHDDHYAELPALLSLLYARRELREQPVELFLDASSWVRFRPLFRNAAHLAPHRLAKLDDCWPLGQAAALRPLPAFHSAIGRTTTRGVQLAVNDCGASFVITSDTRWDKRLADAYAELRGQRTVLVAHVSTARPCELNALAGRGKALHPKHLAVLGTCRAIEALQPCCVVLSEVGEELAPLTGDPAHQPIRRLASLLGETYARCCQPAGIRLTVGLMADRCTFHTPEPLDERDWA